MAIRYNSLEDVPEYLRKYQTDNAKTCTERRLNAKSERLQSKKVVSSQAKESPQKRQTTIKIGYPGSVITENHYLGRNGKATYVKPEARAWQRELIADLERCGVKSFKLPFRVTITGVFKDNRSVPDCHNFKLLFDTIQTVTGINDREFHTETIPGKIDKNQDPHLLIKIAEL